MKFWSELNFDTDTDMSPLKDGWPDPKQIIPDLGKISVYLWIRICNTNINKTSNAYHNELFLLVSYTFTEKLTKF